MNFGKFPTPGRRRFLMAAASAVATSASSRVRDRSPQIQEVLAASFQPVVQLHSVPGFVVGLLLDGQPHFWTSGFTAREGGTAVTPDTLFELGSISKCFTSLLAGVASAERRLDLEQPVDSVLPFMRGTPLGQASPLHLATYTAGGLPLQFPQELTSNNQALSWLAAFTPSSLPGAFRRYSNPSIGLLGHATAKAMGAEFSSLVQDALFTQLRLDSTFIEVPAGQMYRYAWGHDQRMRQVRVNPGVFDAEAYGIKSTARDMLRYLQAVMEPEGQPQALQKALALSTVPRYQIGPMQQCMGWEMYGWPVRLQDLQTGNSLSTVLESQSAESVQSHSLQARYSFLNKTGSTGGFGAYAALVPAKRAALVMLANRNYPVMDRVTAAHQVLSALVS